MSIYKKSTRVQNFDFEFVVVNLKQFIREIIRI